MDHASSPAEMRAFGHAADLDLDLDAADRPGLVTAVLAHCGERRDATFWWSLPVSARTAALLRLVAITEDRDRIALNARCVLSECREAFEFELPLLALAAPGSGGDPVATISLAGDRAVTLRAPTGEDLRAWRGARPASRADAIRMMIESLVVAGEATPGDEAALSEAIAAIDPLVAFSVSCRCPACGAANEVVVDLEALALARLAGRQRALLREVHCLASHYGWTERDVLAVPSVRRTRYLAMIEAER